MTTPRSTRGWARPGRWLQFALALWLAAGLPAASSAALRPQGLPRSETPRQERLGGGDGAAPFDSRSGGTAVTRPGAVPAQRVLATSLGPLGVLDLDPRTGTPRMVSRLDGFLTDPSGAAAADVALGYVRANLAAFGLTESDIAGLKLVREYEDVLGTHHLIWQQTYGGIPVWDNDLRAHVTADGRLVAIGSSPLPGPRVPSVRPRVPARIAVAVAYRSVGAEPPELGRSSAPSGRQREMTFSSGDDARLVLFGTARGARLAWRTTTRIDAREIEVSIVDATTSEVLWRANQVKADQVGTGDAWEYYPSVTVPNGGGLEQQVSYPVVDATRLFGNNAWVWPDVDDDDSPDREIPATAGLDWTYPAPLDTTDQDNACSEAFPCTWRRDVPFSWRANVESNAVQVYHYLNAFHDHLLASPIGFTEAAGNFQVDNPSNLGLGGDPVVANVMDGADTRGNNPGLPDADHVYNANMFTPPDGNPPLMQMYLFPAIAGAGVPSTTGGDDASIVYHEYAHGLSNRLVTLADGSGALSSTQAGAMGEAWSDFYAMDYLVSRGFAADTAAADVIVGLYVGGGRTNFVRTEPIDCAVFAITSACPGGFATGPGGYTYGDFGHVADGPEVHADGEIWVQTLWDIRAALGSEVTLALVTRGMELSPPEPSFLDMRNAILQADLVAFEGSHSDQLWELFAHRGMGFFAIAIDGADAEPVEDFAAPPVCPTDCGSVAGAVADSRTGAPVTGVEVAIAGHASGFLGDLADVTDAEGEFSIAGVPFHEYIVTVRSDDHEPVRLDVTVDGAEEVGIGLTRDWASLAGGATLRSFSGPDYSPLCGPELAWDASLGTGWGSDHPDNDSSGSSGRRSNVVKLPRAIDISTFGFATGGTCGDGPGAAVKAFEIQTRTMNGTWETAYERSKKLELGVLHTLRPLKGAKRNVRFVRLVMKKNYGDPLFMDVLELSVRGKPA